MHSYAIPYVTFMGETLPNNSYVNFSRVGDHNSDGEGVQCYTDLTTCCSRHQGNDSGNWYAPGSTTGLPFSGHLKTTFQRRESQKVTLYHSSRVLPSDHFYVTGRNIAILALKFVCLCLTRMSI